MPKAGLPKFCSKLKLGTPGVPKNRNAFLNHRVYLSIAFDSIFAPPQHAVLVAKTNPQIFEPSCFRTCSRNAASKRISASIGVGSPVCLYLRSGGEQPQVPAPGPCQTLPQPRQDIRNSPVSLLVLRFWERMAFCFLGSFFQSHFQKAHHIYPKAPKALLPKKSLATYRTSYHSFLQTWAAAQESSRLDFVNTPLKETAIEHCGKMLCARAQHIRVI